MSLTFRHDDIPNEYSPFYAAETPAYADMERIPIIPSAAFSPQVVNAAGSPG